MGVKKLNLSTIQQYTEIEDASSIKHEYEGGEVLAMTGGSLNHGILCGNAYNELRAGVEQDDACNAFGSEIRIHIEAADAIVYPDAMVICGTIQTSEEDVEAVTNPVLIVEVLSKSTESYDRGDKFYKYQQLESFQEYVLVAQDKAVVETFFRKDTNVWEIARFSGLDAMVELKSIPVSIKMSQLFVKVN
ncbi:MAG: Uma2 family endonuclease [Bacteroidota bacterium]